MVNLTRFLKAKSTLHRPRWMGRSCNYTRICDRITNMKAIDTDFDSFRVKALELTEKVQPFVDFADEAQSKSLCSYEESQRNSLEKARFSFERSLNDYVQATRDCIAEADREANKKLRASYDSFRSKGV